MILNNKGSLLPVAVASMLIIMVAGLATMKLFSMQNLVSVADQAKIRTYYAAEGVIEKTRYFIDHIDLTNELLISATSGASWEDSSSPRRAWTEGSTICFKTWSSDDSTSMKPVVQISSATLTRANDTERGSIAKLAGAYANYADAVNYKTGEDTTGKGGTYCITATASATVSNNFASQTITTTLKYYFVSAGMAVYQTDPETGAIVTNPETGLEVFVSTDTVRKFVCWRKTVTIN